MRELVKFSKKYQNLFRQDTPCRYFLITGGRGSGKSFALSTWECTDINSKKKPENTLYLRQTLTSAHLSVIPEFWGKISLLKLSGNFLTTKTEIVHKYNGSQIFFRGIKSSSKSNEANLKSVHNVTTVIIDEAQETSEREFDAIDLSIRSVESQNRIILSLNPTPDREHWIYQRFFKMPGVPDDYNGIIGDTCYIHTSYLDNLRNLSEDFVAAAEKCKSENLAKYRNLFLGFWGGSNENALWKNKTIDASRSRSVDPDELDRIVVAIDPAVTSRQNSDETGIVVAGVKRGRNGADDHFYILEDGSLRGTPAEWAKAALELYYYYDADRIIGEVNNGGDLIETVIRNEDSNASFKAVRATRGKILRAEPVAALYEKERVHHAGYFAQLESQMCNYTGAEGQKSPDRLDALVWGITELMDDSSGFVQQGANMALTY